MDTLLELDTAFHHFFFHEARRGTQESRTEFIQGMIGILESQEARRKPRPDETQRLLLKWEHLNVLMGALRRAVDPIDQASRLVQSREHADRLLAFVAGRGQGVPAGDLANHLGISRQHLSKLLRELEILDVIERHPAGRNVYVRLGLVGQLLVEREPAAVPTPPAEELERWFPESRTQGPLYKPLTMVTLER